MREYGTYPAIDTKKSRPNARVEGLDLGMDELWGSKVYQRGRSALGLYTIDGISQDLNSLSSHKLPLTPSCSSPLRPLILEDEDDGQTPSRTG